MVRYVGEEDQVPRVVFCDLERLPGQNGFQRLYSSPGNMRPFVAFDVFLESPVTDNFRYISFSQTLTDLGADFNTEAEWSFLIGPDHSRYWAPIGGTLA